MKRWTEYDPHTSITEVCEYDEDLDRLLITKHQDCTDVVERNKELRATRATDAGIKKGWWHYMEIPVGIQYELLWKHGVNIMERDQWPRLFDLINKEYPALKSTDKTHSMRGGSRRIIVA